MSGTYAEGEARAEADAGAQHRAHHFSSFTAKVYLDENSVPSHRPRSARGQGGMHPRVWLQSGNRRKDWSCDAETRQPLQQRASSSSTATGSASWERRPPNTTYWQDKGLTAPSHSGPEPGRAARDLGKELDDADISDRHSPEILPDSHAASAEEGPRP